VCLRSTPRFAISWLMDVSMPWLALQITLYAGALYIHTGLKKLHSTDINTVDLTGPFLTCADRDLFYIGYINSMSISSKDIHIAPLAYATSITLLTGLLIWLLIRPHLQGILFRIVAGGF